MKRLFTVLLVSLLCVHIASAQTRATRRSEFKIIDPADTVKIQIKKPGVKVRYNSDGKKLNYMSDSLLIVYSPDSVKQHYDPKKEVYYKMEFSDPSVTHPSRTPLRIPRSTSRTQHGSAYPSAKTGLRMEPFPDWISTCLSTARW